ncbi:MAG: hypothetical protein RR952_06685 [Cetobacterium sp.]
MKNTILFLDMDGCLADFDKGIKGDLNNMYKEGFFLSLEPMELGLNETIKSLQEQGIQVKVLSKACVDKKDWRYLSQTFDKVDWIKKHIPCIDELDIIIQGIDESKGSVVDYYREHNCILLDDYSKNLVEWCMSGGLGIKKAKRIKNERPWKQILNISELSEEGL